MGVDKENINFLDSIHKCVTDYQSKIVPSELSAIPTMESALSALINKKWMYDGDISIKLACNGAAGIDCYVYDKNKKVILQILVDSNKKTRIFMSNELDETASIDTIFFKKDFNKWKTMLKDRIDNSNYLEKQEKANK